MLIGAAVDLFGITGDIIGALRGDKRAAGRLPRRLTGVARTYIPFYRNFVQTIAAVSGTKNLDTYGLRVVRSMLDESYKPDPKAIEAERGLVGAFQHALFGGAREGKQATEDLSPEQRRRRARKARRGR